MQFIDKQRMTPITFTHLDVILGVINIVDAETKDFVDTFWRRSRVTECFTFILFDVYNFGVMT